MMDTGSEYISEGILELETNVVTYRSDTDGCGYPFAGMVNGREVEESRVANGKVGRAEIYKSAKEEGMSCVPVLEMAIQPESITAAKRPLAQSVSQSSHQWRPSQPTRRLPFLSPE
jgi:hypothetical protein